MWACCPFTALALLALLAGDRKDILPVKLLPAVLKGSYRRPSETSQARVISGK